MVRLHLAQIFYNPAYYDSPVDLLEEPSAVGSSKAPLGLMRDVDEVSALLLEIKSDVVCHTRSKLVSLAQWSASRGADVLVFPEYSVPVQALPNLKQVAKENNLTIVAGSHRVAPGAEAAGIYADVGISSAGLVGTSISPVLLPTGHAHVVVKATQSKWEPNLRVVQDAQQHCVIEVPCRNETFRLGVVLCIDALSPRVLGDLWSAPERRPALVVCPSLSPSTVPFESIGDLASLNEAVFAYVNAGLFGGTVFYVPDEWKGQVRSSAGTFAPLPPNLEGVIEAQFEPSRLFLKRHSTQSHVFAERPLLFPICYGTTQPWKPQLDNLRAFVTEALGVNDIATAVEYLDVYLSEPESEVPDIALQNLKRLRHAILPLYDGTLRNVTEAFEIAALPSPNMPTSALWARQTQKALDTILRLIARDTTDSLPVHTWECLKELKRSQRLLPAVPQGPDRPPQPLPPVDTTWKGEANLIEAFQNRGSDFDRVRDFTQNPEARVFFVTGPPGIGKTDFLNAVFQKNLRDWRPIRIPIASGTRVARLVADIGFRLGVGLDIDSLAAATHNVFRQKVRKILTNFFSEERRALVLDDIHDLLRNATARDYRHFETLFEEARSPQNYVGGRVIVVSSTWVRTQWLNAPGVVHIHLRELPDIYTRRIIEYQLRLAGSVKGEAPPAIPQQLLDLVRGHPLSARLLVDAAKGRELAAVAADLPAVTEHIALELLRHVQLSPEQQLALSSLSVFRLPVRAERLDYDETGVPRSALEELAQCAVLSFDGALYSMHEAVRRFYYGRASEETRRRYHRIAMAYYDREYDEMEKRGVRNPSTLAELAYHAGMTGDAALTSRLRKLVIEELKPAARQIYREDRDYWRALKLYRTIADITPDDPEVIAYVGRCYARLGSWEESDKAFARAIEIAGRKKDDWWIYRDWGHILARYAFYSRAQECFCIAEERRSRDASISAALGYMHWRVGDVDSACERFEEALQINPNHGYTLSYYARLLDELGQHDRAEGMRDRLRTIESWTRPPSEHDIDLGAEDLEDL